MTTCLKTKLVDNSNVNDTTSWTTRDVFSTNESINEGGFTVSNGSVIVPDDGVYLCCFSCYFVTDGSRENVGVRWVINGDLQGEISGSNYMRDSSRDEANTDLQTLYSLNAGDTLELSFARLADSSSVTLQGNPSFISIVKLNTTGTASNNVSSTTSDVWSIRDVYKLIASDAWPTIAPPITYTYVKTYLLDDSTVNGESLGTPATLDSNLNSGLTLSNGNLTFYSDYSNRDTCMTNAVLSSGKWYWELTVTQYRIAIGIEPDGYVPQPDSRIGTDSAGYSWWLDRTNLYHDGSNVDSSYGSSVSSGDIIGVALDLDNGTLEFFKNGSSEGVAFTGISGSYVPAVSDCANIGDAEGTLNFGQNNFTYTPPSGFTAGVPAS